MHKSTIVLAFAVLAVALFQGANAELGIDTTHHPGLINATNWKCFNQSGYDFALLNVFHRNNTNQYFPHNYKLAKKYFNHVDVMATLCSNKTVVKNKAKKISRELGKHFERRIFLEVAPLENCWGTNQTYNLEYVESVARTLHKYGFHLGVLSNASNWMEIMGNTSKTSLSSLPLWYASNDTLAQFDNHNQSEFAGWKVPELKQYQQNVSKCGTYVNLDYADGAPIHKPHNSTNGSHAHHHVKHGHKSHSHGHKIKTSDSKKRSYTTASTSITASHGSNEDSTELSDSITLASESTRYNSFSTDCEGSDCYYETTTYQTAGSEPSEDVSLASDTYTYPSTYEGPEDDGTYYHETEFSGLTKTAYENEDDVDIDDDADGAVEIADNADMDAIAGASDEVVDVVVDIILAILAIF